MALLEHKCFFPTVYKRKDKHAEKRQTTLYNVEVYHYWHDHQLWQISDLSLLVWGLSIETTVLKLTPQTVVLKNVHHSRHLTEDQHARSCKPSNTLATEAATTTY